MNINTLHLKPGIYRVNGTRHGYSRISDTFARDGKLSARGRSVGLYILSHREGFVLKQATIAHHLEVSEVTVRGAFADLAAGGYMRSGTAREGQRVIGTWYVIHDEQLTEEQWEAELFALTEHPVATHPETTESVPTGTSVHKGNQVLKCNQEVQGQEKSTPSADADAPPRAPSQPPLINLPPPEPWSPVQAGVQPEHRQDEEDHKPAANEIAENGHLPLLENSSAGRSCSPAAARKQLAEQHWDEFWQVWQGKKLDRPAAETKWTRAVVTLKADPETVIAAARRYRAQFNGDLTYMKHPKTWLHNQCWEDELPMRPGEGLPEDRVQAWLQGHRESGNAEDAARESGVAWCGWQVYLTPDERLTAESRREALVRWGRAWIGDHETELVAAMTRRTG